MLKISQLSASSSDCSILLPNMDFYLTGAAKPAHGFEKDVHSGCLSCGEYIRHPICPECLAKGYRQWIQQFSDEHERINEKLEKFLGGHKVFNGKSLLCVSCGLSRTHLCPHCFTKFLHKITKEAGVGVRLLSEFMFIFNFDFDGHGFSAELDVFGGY